MTVLLPRIISDRNHVVSGTLMVAGILLTTLAEAITGTILSLGRNNIIGDIHATPDEFAWLDVGYTTSKLIAFTTAHALSSRIEVRRLLVGASLLMGLACAVAPATTRLDLLIALRIAQGFSGGTLLVAGQTLLFIAYPRRFQPILQALFAMGAVVAPATAAPALQGWLLDIQSWSWVFFCAVPFALAGAGILMLAESPQSTGGAKRPFDWLGIVLISTAQFCFSYVLSQGSRWNWFEEPRIGWLSGLGAVAFVGFILQQAAAKDRGLLTFTCFRSQDFLFAFIVSFVAGAALFGSAYLIPAFAASVLGFTPTAAGQLLLPSGAPFIAALLVAAVLMQFRRIPPIATVPFGILMVMTAMWMLSGSTSESGTADMMSAVLLRGFGLGFLFLSITLIAFGNLGRHALASGIGIFNMGRQVGGLIGVAALQTLIDRNLVANATVLNAHISSGSLAVNERLTAVATMLSGKGLDTAAAVQGARSLLGKAVAVQSTVIAFNTAFIAVALLFVAAVPVLVAVKIALVRFNKRPPRRDS
ncbi:MFS transporter [Bosea sp. AS-1]|uniref:MFS transporter n=1 Tax=Bosea sp. AS-1 TaxID=2015316 RepID=UPI000B7992CA|nr:MFS transporter [Bosea sp. AS-1]